MKTLYKQLFSKKNIYKAIYSIESYVFEKELLDDESIELYYKLSDKYNTSEIELTIRKCREKLIEVLRDDNKFFKLQVFFKPKKIDNEKEIYRPMHTADLITQICIVAMLNLIMFDDNDSTRKLSDICKLIPSNFYGNIPDTRVDQIFKHWSKQYADYSSNIIIANKEYSENKKYRREVNLDIEHFFPSVDPTYIYSIIWKKVSHFYTENNDSEGLKKILLKLLYFEIDFPKNSLDISEYYSDVKDVNGIIKSGKSFYNIGIPQGLPQAYLFGNLCMIEVARTIAEKIEGDAYYYVDDSVIFTNVEKATFGNLIDVINNELAKRIKGNIDDIELPICLKSHTDFCSDIYRVKIHDYIPLKSKTTIIDISIQNNLWELAKPASTTAFQLKATFNDLEDETLKRKLESLIKYIDRKLMTNDDNDQKKLLQRYRKFYSYRLKILEYRYKNQITKEEQEDFYSRYGIQSINKKQFFEKLEDEIFIREAQMILKYSINDEGKRNGIIKSIKLFEDSLDKKITNNYFSKVLTQYSKFLLHDNIQYEILQNEVKKSLPPYIKSNPLNSQNEINEIIVSGKLPGSLAKYESGFYEFIYKNSEEFKRKIYNSLISYILSVPVNDNFNLLKIDGRAIYYYELRLLVSLRIDHKFDFIHFKELSNKILGDIENNNEKVDLTLFEVLPIFKKYVHEQDQIDELILTHRFVNGIWKNGSKFLHFYTLHNEEHSVELIKYCTQITKSIDYLSIKSFDYYVLFLACYLHDIAMVIYPNLNNFGKIDEVETELAITKWKDTFKTKFSNKRVLDGIQTNFYPDLSNSNDIAEFILHSYHLINNFFENKIRKNHARDSGNFIRKQNDLSFIQKLTKRFVAEISEGHGHEARDIYGLKSKAKDDIVSEKYLMILLRLADLMDMAKDRVSINVLKQSIGHMPDESKFQWISHLAVDKCTVETEFELPETENKEEEKMLKITERVIFKIYLNTRILTAENYEECKNLRCKISPKLDNIEILINPVDLPCSNCNFTSKWIMKKHSYLFDELKDLHIYLTRNSNNSVFDTSFKVILKMKNSNQLPAEFIDVISNKIL